MNARRRETIEVLAHIQGAATVLQIVLSQEDIAIGDRAAERTAAAVMLWLRDHGWDPPIVTTDGKDGA